MFLIKQGFVCFIFWVFFASSVSFGLLGQLIWLSAGATFYLEIYIQTNSDEKKRESTFRSQDREWKRKFLWCEREEENMLGFTTEILHLKKNVNPLHAEEYHFSLEMVLNRTEAIEI